MALIEATVIRHLAEEMETEHVYAERPIDLPEEYFLVEKTAAGESNHIQRATIIVQSISAKSMLRAAEMSREAERAMRKMIHRADISRCKLNSAYNYTNPESREYRYQAVFDIYYMEGE